MRIPPGHPRPRPQPHRGIGPPPPPFRLLRRTMVAPPPTTKKRKRATAKPWYDGVKKRRAVPRTATIAAVAVRRTNLAMRSLHPGTGFADLPGELRNKIYELALTCEGGTAIRITSGMGNMGRSLALGLLSLCKGVRKEALGYFLESNSFRVDVIKLDKNTRPEGPLEYYTDCYDSRHKAYEAPLREFMDCAKFTTRLNKAYGLKSIPSFTFAYFNEDPNPTATTTLSSRPLLRERADLVVIWALQSTSPYYTLTVDRARSKETDQDDVNEVLLRMRSTINGMTENRDVRMFAAKDVIDIADRFYYSCMNLDMGV